VDEKSSEIIDEIETSRDRLGENLNDLESRMREAANWRTYFERHPYMFIGTAVGGGLLLSGILRGSKRSDGGTVRHEVRPAGFQREKSPGAEILDQVKTALMLYGAAKAKDVLGEILPGFRKYADEANRV
jgi:hypothetical protein